MDKLWTPTAPQLIKTPTKPKPVRLPKDLQELQDKVNEELRGFGFTVQ